MTSLRCRTSGTRRRRRNTAAQRWFKARHTCSAVTCGFFPPQPLGLRGHKTQHHQRQDQVPHQPRVVPPFIVHQARLLLGQTETVFHTPAAKRHRQKPRHRRAAVALLRKYLTSAVASLMATEQQVLPAGHPNHRRSSPARPSRHRPMGQPIPLAPFGVGRTQPLIRPLRRPARACRRPRSSPALRPRSAGRPGSRLPTAAPRPRSPRRRPASRR